MSSTVTVQIRTPDSLPPPPWPGAACTGLPTDLFYSDDPDDEAAARAICVACPTAAVCRLWSRREPAGVWAGLNRTQRDLAGLSLAPAEWCTVCGEQLPDGHTASVCDSECYRQRSISVRKQSRAEQSAARCCDRCEAALWPQSRSCLVCGQITGADVPNRPWPPARRTIPA